MWPYTNPVDPSIYDKNIDWPKISIVTPSYNQGKFIEETILSVINQNYPNLEYIIIDGGSTDNTLEIIQKYKDHIKYWISEPDGGQANAINKGLEKCTGMLFNWINSDDYLTNKALYILAKSYTPEIQIYAGYVNNFSDDNSYISNYIGVKKNNDLSIYSFLKQKSTFYYHQPGVWLNISKFQVPKLNESSHFCFDLEMLLSILEVFPKIYYIKNTLVNFRLHGTSKTISSMRSFDLEQIKIKNKYASHPENEFRSLIKKQYQKRVWHRYISIKSMNEKTPIFLAKLLCATLSHPNIRIDRFTLGAVKNNIFR